MTQKSLSKPTSALQIIGPGYRCLQDTNLFHSCIPHHWSAKKAKQVTFELLNALMRCAAVASGIPRVKRCSPRPGNLDDGERVALRKGENTFSCCLPGLVPEKLQVGERTVTDGFWDKVLVMPYPSLFLALHMVAAASRPCESLLKRASIH
jgi:hypothetical protein